MNLGAVAFFAVGAYTSAPWPSAACPCPGVAGGIALAAAAGAALRSWLRLRGDHLAIVTLGFAEVLRLFCSTRPGSPVALTGDDPALLHTWFPGQYHFFI